MPRPVPFVDLAGQYREIKPEITAAIEAVLTSCAFVGGPFVDRFETAFTRLLGAAHGVGCDNGTAALSLALEALGIGAGDEVITVSHTFFATTEAIHQVGATPVFVEIDPLTYTMDPAAAARAVTARTRALLPVHIHGTPCDMTALLALAKAHDLRVVEDCAQAHLATLHGQIVGTFGDAGAFSFFPGKNLGAYGDAGFVTLRDAAVAERVRKLREHGAAVKFRHELFGYNHRLDGLQAAILQVKLNHLERWTANRRAHAARYDAALEPRGFQVMKAPAGGRCAYHLYVVQVANREAVQAHLNDHGIATGIHYPVPVHRQPALSHLGHGEGFLPVTEALARRTVSLPLCGSLQAADVDRVCERFLEIAQP